MGVPSDMHIETNMRESQNTKNEYINIDKIMGMNIHIIQTESNFQIICNISTCNVITFPVDSNLAFRMETPANT